MCVDVCTVRVLVFSRASNVGISVGWELGTLILERALALTLLDLLLLRVPLTPQQHTEQTPASVYMHVSNRSCPQKTQKLNPRYFLRVIKQRRRRDGGTSTGGPAGGPGGGQRRRRDGWQRDGPVRHHHTFLFLYSRHDHLTGQRVVEGCGAFYRAGGTYMPQPFGAPAHRWWMNGMSCRRVSCPHPGGGALMPDSHTYLAVFRAYRRHDIGHPL